MFLRYKGPDQPLVTIIGQLGFVLDNQNRLHVRLLILKNRKNVTSWEHDKQVRAVWHRNYSRKLAFQKQAG